jgi:hypothetical protein
LVSGDAISAATVERSLEGAARRLPRHPEVSVLLAEGGELAASPFRTCCCSAI